MLAFSSIDAFNEALANCFELCAMLKLFVGTLKTSLNTHATLLSGEIGLKQDKLNSYNHHCHGELEEYRKLLDYIDLRGTRSFLVMTFKKIPGAIDLIWTLLSKRRYTPNCIQA